MAGFIMGVLDWATILSATRRKVPTFYEGFFVLFFLRDWVFKYTSTEPQRHGESQTWFPRALSVFYLLQVWAGRTARPQRAQTTNLTFKPRSHTTLVRASPHTEKTALLYTASVLRHLDS